MNIESKIVETKALLTCSGRMDAVSAPASRPPARSSSNRGARTSWRT